VLIELNVSQTIFRKVVEIIDGESVYHKLSLFKTQHTNAHEIVYDTSGILKPHSSVCEWSMTKFASVAVTQMLTNKSGHG